MKADLIKTTFHRICFTENVVLINTVTGKEAKLKEIVKNNLNDTFYVYNTFDEKTRSVIQYDSGNVYYYKYLISVYGNQAEDLLKTGIDLPTLKTILDL